MRCAKVREVIVLQVSGDATERQSRRATSHIADCLECRRFAAEEPLSLVPLRTGPPLSDADFSAIRARVLSRIAESETRRPLSLPFRFAVALAIAVLIGLGAFLSIRRTNHSAAQWGAGALAGGGAGAPPSTVPVRAAPPAPTPIETPRIERVRVARRHRHRAPNPVTLIQIQTADPDVRIIWIVNPKRS